MSTPTTATAPLPPHYRHHHHPAAHHHHYPSYPTLPPSGAAYRNAPSAANPILPAPSSASTASTAPVSSRPAQQPQLPQQSHHYQTAYHANQVYPAHDTSHSAVYSNGVGPSIATARHNSTRTHSTPRSEPNYMPPSTATAAHTYADMHARKRRRSKEPDWKTFYKNGLPKEIIVIDDTPEPDDNRSAAASSRPYADSTVNGSVNDRGVRHVAKKRKKDDSVKQELQTDPTRATRSYPQPSSGSASTDRTTSAYNTTAPTSLSSNGQYEYEPQQPGQKRKRTTRQQAVQDAKRREVEVLTDGFHEYQPPKKPIRKSGEVHVRLITNERPHLNSIKVDDDDGHFIVVPDAELTQDYTIAKLLGQGTFGKVVQARDRKRNKLVAIKIIRAVQKYRDASRIELRVLETLKMNDPENRNRCIHLRDCFDYRGHICIVMDLLGSSVFDFLKSNNFVPFPNSQIQSFARQLLTSVAFLHDLSLVHTDLKPENILLCDNAYQTFTYNRRIPSSATGVNRQATQRKVLLDTEIRLIDFGSATFNDEYHSSVVSTRHYRAPEIILGLGWSFPCDIWSIGCILVEFFTGDALFQTHDNLEHLAMMENVCDNRIDQHLVQMVNKQSSRTSSNSPAKYFKRLKLDYPASETTRASRRFVRNMKRLSDIIPSTSPFLRLFLDLLQKIFVYDPQQRITARQALSHPWFQEAAIPDDGTEAIKIRLERCE
ncbi:kinase-like domain-containing protein [Xylariaceae sp. FL1019]|nr:kinase-like domain-containing protein [Xylariaceae sp. FL1019]